MYCIRVLCFFRAPFPGCRTRCGVLQQSSRFNKPVEKCKWLQGKKGMSKRPTTALLRPKPYTCQELECFFKCCLYRKDVNGTFCRRGNRAEYKNITCLHLLLTLPQSKSSYPTSKKQYRLRNFCRMKKIYFRCLPK
jgi:hypothetical protein